jgi:hypothetical protein
MSKHTAGKWYNDGEIIMCRIDAVTTRMIASCTQSYGDGKQNARIIAAAPDMLEALILIHRNGTNDSHIKRLIEATIEFATGESIDGQSEEVKRSY